MQPRAPAIRSGFTPARSAPPPRPDPFAPPIALYGEIAVKSGTEAEVPTGSISNNAGRTIDVREIRFNVSIADHGANQYLNPAGVLTVALTVNGKPLQATPTPVWSLCRLDRAANQLVEETRLATTYVMRLSRVMQLPPGAEVRCKFAHNGIVPFTVTGGVCLAGRFTDQRSATTALPYALFWASTPRGQAEASSEVSPEKALANTLKTTLHVDRIIARHITMGSGTPVDPTVSSIFMGDGRGGAGANLSYIAPVEQLTSLKLVTSRNQPIIPISAPIWDVFPTSGAIEVPHTLPPNEFYRAAVTTVSARAAMVAAMADIKTYQHQLHLSMVGWREEAL